MRSPSFAGLIKSSVLATSLVVLLAACANDRLVSPLAQQQSASLPMANQGVGPQECRPDSKLIGRVLLSTADVPGTWWNLTRQGMDNAGYTNYLPTLELWFGQSFADLAAAIAHVVNSIQPFDENNNGYVCAYDLRGTRTSIGIVNANDVVFHVMDDKHTN